FNQKPKIDPQPPIKATHLWTIALKNLARSTTLVSPSVMCLRRLQPLYTAIATKRGETKQARK
ncbi:hypothetical protein, partial [Staphylococcus nepalensis]|uniref:hypothetical protein n=1 Tax=Staphylococcus nepalensis TaxID=214473 RepID=UPI00285AED5B